MITRANDRELDVLLELLGRSGFLVHRFDRDHDGPALLAAVREYPGVADVVVLVDRDHAAAWRTPTGAGIDVLTPHCVYWSYAASAVWTLRSLLTLALPGYPDAPGPLGPAPAGLGLPAEIRRPVSITGRAWR